MYTSYDCDFRWPEKDCIFLKNIYVPVNPTKALEALEQRAHMSAKNSCENDKNDEDPELPLQLEWTSTAPFGRLLERKLIPIYVTAEEQRRIDDLIASDDFNFLPCPHKKSGKPVEDAVRSIAAQTGIAYEELMKEVYEKRDQWHQTAIGQAATYMRDAFEKKRSGRSGAKEMVF